METGNSSGVPGDQNQNFASSINLMHTKWVKSLISWFNFELHLNVIIIATIIPAWILYPIIGESSAYGP